MEVGKEPLSALVINVADYLNCEGQWHVYLSVFKQGDSR